MKKRTDRERTKPNKRERERGRETEKKISKNEESRGKYRFHSVLISLIDHF